MLRTHRLIIVASLCGRRWFAPTSAALAVPTVWSGFDFTFTKPNDADFTSPQFQDRITDNVWLTRSVQQGIFNIQQETGYDGVTSISPAGTAWATNVNNPSETITAANWSHLSFTNWVEAYGGAGSMGLPTSLTSHNAVVHLIADDIYLDLQFTAWTGSAGGGGFSYNRALPPPGPTTTGDYNLNGVIDAADYVVWRDTLGQTADPMGSGADGDESGLVDAGDYDFWQARFGDIVPLVPARSMLRSCQSRRLSRCCCRAFSGCIVVAPFEEQAGGDKFMNRYRITVGLVAMLVAMLAGTPAYPFAHLWDINEIFTNHDGTVQFVELRTPATLANGENFLNGVTLRATSTVGGIAMPPVTFTFPLPNPVGGTNNKHLLVATPLFQAQAGSVTPNYNTLPANFFVPNADSIVFTYSAGPDSVTLAGSVIPKDGVNSVTDANLFGVANFVAGVNSPTNFAGASGSVNLPPPPMPTGDYNGNGTIDAADYVLWRDTLGATVTAGQGADGNASGMIETGDYDFWRARFGNSVPGVASAFAAVPEPAAAILLLAALGCLACRRR